MIGKRGYLLALIHPRSRRFNPIDTYFHIIWVIWAIRKIVSYYLSLAQEGFPAVALTTMGRVPLTASDAYIPLIIPIVSLL
jgi:hypothetical protein